MWLTVGVSMLNAQVPVVLAFCHVPIVESAQCPLALRTSGIDGFGGLNSTDRSASASV